MRLCAHDIPVCRSACRHVLRHVRVCVCVCVCARARVCVRIHAAIEDMRGRGFDFGDRIGIFGGSYGAAQQRRKLKRRGSAVTLPPVLLLLLLAAVDSSVVITAAEDREEGRCYFTHIRTHAHANIFTSPPQLLWQVGT